MSGACAVTFAFHKGRKTDFTVRAPRWQKVLLAQVSALVLLRVEEHFSVIRQKLAGLVHFRHVVKVLDGLQRD